MSAAILRQAREPSLVYAKPARVTGLETLEARSSDKLWTVYHDTFTFLLLHRGYGEFQYRRGTHAIEAGGMMCLEPGNVHVDRRIARCNDFSVFFVDPGVVAEILGTSARRLPHFEAPSVESSILASCARRLRAALLDSPSPAEARDALASLVRQAFALNAERLPRSRGGHCAEHDIVRRALRILQDSARKHSLSDLARGVGNVSPEHLIRRFAAEIGVTPHQYLLQLRVREARRLLHRGIAPRVAAECVGFSDQSHLHRHFRRIVGVTPGDYQLATRPPPRR